MALASHSASSLLESDAWVTNGNAAEPILHAAGVNNEDDVEIVTGCWLFVC